MSETFALRAEPGCSGDPRDPFARLALLLDAGSLELHHGGDLVAVTVVRGLVHGVPVIAFCTDATKRGGAVGIEECRRIASAIDLAVLENCAVIGLWHSGGAKLDDGVEAMDGIGRIFAATVNASGKVPQISVMLGPAAGGAAYGAALTDIIIMAPAGRVFITGPAVVRSVTGEDIDMEGLGGPEPHSRKSGVAHVIAESEADACRRAGRFAALLSRPGTFQLDTVRHPRDLRALLPENSRRAYDVRPLVHQIVDSDVDGNVFEELHAKWAPNVVTGIGRLARSTVGVVANNPLRKGGCLDSLSAEKAARFVRMCDALGIPLVVIVDVPGYLPGVGQEWGGVVRRGAKLLYAFAEARVPRVTLITRKSYGGAYIAMNSRSLGATSVFAWPDAEVAVMGAESAVAVMHRKVLQAAPESDREALRAALIEEQKCAAGGIDRALFLGVVDEVIDPAQTRLRLAAALAAAPPRRGQHGNMPH